jgi:hypothetical protein
MATRKRFTDDELFKLADEAQERWGTVTVSALQQAAGGGSAARFKKIIAEWEQRRHQGERSPSNRGVKTRNRRAKTGRAALAEEPVSVSDAPAEGGVGAQEDAAGPVAQAAVEPQHIVIPATLDDAEADQVDDLADSAIQDPDGEELPPPSMDIENMEPVTPSMASQPFPVPSAVLSGATQPGKPDVTPTPMGAGSSGTPRTEADLRAAYDRLLDELQAIRHTHDQERARLNRLIDALMDEVRARP